MFHARIEMADGSYRVEVPEREVTLGEIDPDGTNRVAILPSAGPQPARGTARERGGGTHEPPVSRGERVDVEIEDIGEQGDGLARIGEGYIVFVPETEIGDRVTVEIGKVTENFAFGEVVEGSY